MSRFSWPFSRQFPPKQRRRQRIEELGGNLPCPLCRLGSLESITLMDVFGCSTCHHIFEPDFNQQTIHLADGNQSTIWAWLGERWRPTNPLRPPLPSILWLGLGLFIIGPASLIVLSGYLFPPLESSTGINFPTVWGICTLVSHGLLAIWLVTEYYQLSPFIVIRIGVQRFTERFPL